MKEHQTGPDTPLADRSIRRRDLLSGFGFGAAFGGTFERRILRPTSEGTRRRQHFDLFTDIITSATNLEQHYPGGLARLRRTDGVSELFRSSMHFSPNTGEVVLNLGLSVPGDNDLHPAIEVNINKNADTNAGGGGLGVRAHFLPLDLDKDNSHLRLFNYNYRVGSDYETDGMDEEQESRLLTLAQPLITLPMGEWVIVDDSPLRDPNSSLTSIYAATSTVSSPRRASSATLQEDGEFEYTVSLR